MDDQRDSATSRPHPLSRSLGYHIRQLTESVNNALHSRLNAEGITVGHWRYLRELFQQDGLSNTELSDRVGRRGPTTVVALRSLERAGLVEIVPHPEDRRMRTVHLTARGKSMWQKAAPLLAQVEEIALAGVDPAELTAFKRVILKMQRNMDAADPHRSGSQLRRTEELERDLGD
jgi:DNA-binding MarR family transcriptional regulator